jgi:predicted flap endonuclease-1-like 5' DNA nuclease
MIKFGLFSARKNRSWFWWGINIGIAVAVFVWWWMENQDKTPNRFYPKRRESPVPPKNSRTEAPKKILIPLEPEPAKEDDLRKIEGIGPKSAQALKDSGIKTFSALSKMTPEQIKKALNAAGVRIGFPGTWPEQAALAAAEKWDELNALQSNLHGGRRIE